jgi:glucoamylase
MARVACLPPDTPLNAAGYLLAHGPATAQERWEENSGYSPSTLAVHIAALICAAAFARQRGEPATALYLEEAADFLEAHVEPWTVTTAGARVPDISRHFIRIHPVNTDDPHPDEDANHGLLELCNQAPGARFAYPAKDVVDAGFLELVRFGIRAAGDPLIEDSLRVVDAILKVDTPAGPCWRRSAGAARSCGRNLADSSCRPVPPALNLRQLGARPRHFFHADGRRS